MNTTINKNITYVGDTAYFVSKELLKRIKAACKIAGVHWKYIAARPSTAEEFCESVERQQQRRPVLAGVELRPNSIL